MCEINDEKGKLIRGLAKKNYTNETKVMDELSKYAPRDCGLQKYIDKCHKTAVDHGFWSDDIKDKRDEVILKVGAAFVQITNLIEQIRKGDDNSNLYFDKECSFNSDKWVYNKLLLMGTEISEALVSNDGPELVEELADIFIRLMDLVGYVYGGYLSYYGSAIKPFDDVVKEKMAKNKERPYLHNKEC